MKIDTDILTARLSLAQIAEQIGRSTSWCRDIRSRDSRRWPSASAGGRYSLAAVVTLLDVREAERMTDTQFDQERRERAREALSFGADGIVTRWCREIMAGRHDGQRQAWIDERRADLARYCRRPAGTGATSRAKATQQHLPASW
jgi:hypothetical protein